MNNNVVEKTLKSIDNIDRLSDLAAISIYNTSHEAIDKFDVMQEHATPEYVEGEFVQESLLTGVLIGAGIIGVAISAFLIIKKIIESKAKGDPNAASNTPEGADLTKPEDIQKLFDKWKTEYFNKYPDLAVDNVKCADAKQMSEYATIMTDSVNQFTDRVNVAVDEYMDNGSEEKLIEHINDIAALIGGADISTVLSSEGRIDQSTIGNLEVSAVAIARSFKDFDGIIKNNIANFEKKAKEKNDNGTEEEGSNSKVSEKTIKQFSDILKKKAEETGKIMVSFRKNVLGGFEAAIKAAVNEKTGQTKQQTGNGSNGLTDEQKQRILNIMKVYYPEDEKQINDEINVFDAAESADELKEILDEAYEELSPGKGAKDAFIRIAGVAEQVAAHKHFDWPIRADNYDLKRLDSEDTDTGTDTDARGSGEGEPKTQDNADDQTEEPKNQNTDEASAENAENHEETTETENAEKKDETSSENTEENSHDLDIQYSIGEDGKRKIQVINNGKTTNAGVYWPKEFDESANKLIKASADRGQEIDVFDPAFGMISAINDIYQLGNGNIINYLNFAYSTKNNNEYKNRKYETCKFIAEVLGEPPVDQLPTPPTEPSDETKDEESPKTETSSAEKPTSSETPDDGEKSNNNQATALNNNDILKTVADKYFDGNVDSTKDALEAFNGMPTTNIIRNCIKGSLNEYLVSGSGSLKETIQKYYDFYNEIFKDANLDIHLPDVPDFSDELVSKIKHIWNVKGGFLLPTDFDHMIDAILHNSEEPLNQIDESQLKMGSSEDVSSETEKPGNQNAETNAKTDETSNTKLFTDEEEDKLVNAVYAVKGLKTAFRQEIYKTVTDDGFAEAAKKLYANYAGDANKLNQIHTTLIAMAKSIGKESEVPALPTAEATPTESATTTENQNTDEASAEETTVTPETPKEEEQSETSGEESNGNDIKKISDSTGLDEVKVESIYKILKDNSTPDDVKRAFIINTIGPMIHMPGFNQKMANDGFKINYDNFKKVAEAASIPFEIEQPEISEKDINDIHAIISSTDTEETKLAKIADNLMNSTSEPESEILNTADTTDAIESPNQDQNKPPTQVTSDDLIAAKNANIDGDIAERIAYAINNNKDMISTVVAPAMGTLLADINERPLNSFERSQYLKTYDALVKAFNYFHLDPNQYLDPEKYPDPKSLGILSDEEEAKQKQKTKWWVDLANELGDYLSNDKTVAEFISDKKISEQDVVDALKYIGMGEDISVPIDENKVRRVFGFPELKTQTAPKAQPSSPSNSSTGSRGSNQQSAGKPVNKSGSNQRPAAPKQGAGQSAGKPVNKPKSEAKQQPANKPGFFERFGQFLGL